MTDDRRPKKTMDQVLAHTESLIGQRLGLSAKAPKPLPDPAPMAAAHAADEGGSAEAWLAGWNARVNGGSLDEVAKKWPRDLGLQADAILGWREAEKHLPVRPRVGIGQDEPDILTPAATSAHISGDLLRCPAQMITGRTAKCGNGARPRSA